MRDKFNKFMQGRYGVDDFSRFIMGVALTLIILTMVVTMFNRNVGSILDFLGIAPYMITPKSRCFASATRCALRFCRS